MTPQVTPASEGLVPDEPARVEDALEELCLSGMDPEPVVVADLDFCHHRSPLQKGMTVMVEHKHRAGGPSGAIPPTAQAVGFPPHTPNG